MARSEFNYELALLKLMDSLPDRQGLVEHILKLFEQRHRTDIPSDHFSRNASGYIRWSHRLQGMRHRLVNMGLMDAPRRGVWRLTEGGHRWLRDHPDATRFTDDVLRSKSIDDEVVAATLPATLPEDVVNTRTDQGAVPSVKKAAPAPDNETRRTDLLAAQVAEIRAFLAGRTDQRPSDEKLCDWVHFCYTFEMYLEARDLYALIDSAQVTAWYFERARKLARICALKAGTHA